MYSQRSSPRSCWKGSQRRLRETAMYKAINVGEIAHLATDITRQREQAGGAAAHTSRIAAASIEETLAYCSFPEKRGQRLRRNSSLERILHKIRRRTRMAGSFPHGQSAVSLAVRLAAPRRW